ncbi:MAG: putative lipid II flippase FtsW [Acidimicrobiales bacterium]
MTRPAQARAATAPGRTVAGGRKPEVGETRGAMKLIKGGARPARARRTVHLSLEAKVLLASVTGLCLLGLPIVLSASAPGAILAGGSPWSYVVRQSIYMAIGLTAAVIASRTPVGIVRKLRFVLPLFTLALLVVVFVPGIGHFAGGSSRWIGIGPIQLQPSELMKLAMVVFAADLLARRAKRRDQWNAMVRPLLAFMVVAAVLIVKQPDLGTAVVVCCITFSVLFAAGVRLPVLAASGASVCAMGAVLAFSATYRRDRLLSFVNPFAHASTSGYQVVQSLATLGLGGVTGSGVGGSVTPWGFLPNAHTDFVFAVIAGNLGLVGALIVLAGFAGFGWAGFRIAARERDPFARFVAVGVTCWVLAQAVINIGGVIDALPVTGIPLPFISYGGSSLAVALIAVGLLFGIARRQPAVVPRRSAPGVGLLPVAVSTYPNRTGPPSRRRSRAEPA